MRGRCIDPHLAHHGHDMKREKQWLRKTTDKAQ